MYRKADMMDDDLGRIQHPNRDKRESRLENRTGGNTKKKEQVRM